MIFDPKCGGGGGYKFFFRKTTFSFMFSSRFMLFPTFLEKEFSGVGVSKKSVGLASEPVGGKSQATELPCDSFGPSVQRTFIRALC